MKENICYICFSDDVECDDGYLICDRCDEIYCYECSYTYTIHFQYRGSLCYHCSNQRRRTPLNIRDSKLNYILNNKN
jgi:hypothetical protein